MRLIGVGEEGMGSSSTDHHNYLLSLQVQLFISSLDDLRHIRLGHRSDSVVN